MTHPKTAIVLFTDLVDSTALSVALGPRAELLRRKHFAILRGALTATGGTEIKNLGDGVMAVFTGAAGAVRCAAAIQHAIARHNRRAEVPIAVRIGISAGDVVEEADGDVFGLPVVEAARLCAAAEGGEVLTTGVVVALAGRDEARRLAGAGTRTLKGLPGETEVYRLEWERERADASARGLPHAVVRALDAVALAGRDVETEALDEVWSTVAAGQRRLVLLEGEPGVGKTRLAAELAARAADDGALVLAGRCDPDIRAPMRPWAAVAAGLVAASPPDHLRAHLDRHGAELVRLVPSLGEGGEPPPGPPDGDEVARKRLVDALADLLATAAQRRPVAVVLDDVHWSDRATAAVLRDISRGEQMPLLLIATARDSAVDRFPEWMAVAADLVRDPATVRLGLGGLDPGATVALAHSILGNGDHVDALARDVHAETAGNPLFAVELLRHRAAGGGRAEATPATVKDVLAQRVAVLGEGVAATLAAAAVLGRNFTFDALVALVDRPEDEVLECVERALAAKLVVERADAAGSFSFSHALVQRSFSEDLGAVRAQRLHRRAAEIKESVPRDLGRVAAAADVARHWLAAGDEDRRRATDACERAGRQALALLAPDEAADWFGRALHLHRAGSGEPNRRAAELLLALGDAERRAGLESFRAHLLEAAATAREVGAPDVLVAAALANSRGLHSSFLAPDAERIAVLRDALAVTAHDDVGTRARLLATLASELWSERSERRQVADAALAAARECADADVLVEVLYRRCLTIAEPETTAERLALTAELTDLAADREPAWRLRAAAERMRVCMEVGDGKSAVAQARVQVELAPATGSAMGAYIALTSESWLRAHSGDYAGAEECAQQAAQAGTGVAPDAFAIFGAQLLAFRWDQGRLGELVDLVRQTATAPGALSSQRAILPLALCEAGDREAARRALDDALRDGLPIDLDTLACVTAVLWAEGAARAGHESAARALLDRILPWADQVAFSGVSIFGGVARPCALLAALIGRHDDARGLFAAAERQDRAVGAVGPLARTLADRAEWAVTHSDDAGARTRVAEAAVLAERHGLQGVAERCRAVEVLLGPVGGTRTPRPL